MCVCVQQTISINVNINFLKCKYKNYILISRSHNVGFATKKDEKEKERKALFTSLNGKYLSVSAFPITRCVSLQLGRHLAEPFNHPL